MAAHVFGLEYLRIACSAHKPTERRRDRLAQPAVVPKIPRILRVVGGNAAHPVLQAVAEDLLRKVAPRGGVRARVVVRRVAVT